MTTAIEKFNECCSISLFPGPAGEMILRARARFRDADTGKIISLDKKIDLTPLAKKITRALMKYHLKLHGTMPTVSGWTDFIKKGVRAAKKIAKSSAVKSLYKKAAPFIQKGISSLPGGTAALALATSAHNVLVAAKAGDPKALAKMEAVKKLACTGDARAKYVFQRMQLMNQTLEGREALTSCGGSDIVGWNPFSAAKKAVKKVAKGVRKVAKTAQRVVPIRTLAKVASYAGVPGAAAASALMNRGKGSSRPNRAIAAPSYMAPAPSYASAPQPGGYDGGGGYGGEEYCEEQYCKEPQYFCDEGGYYDEEVGGWIYNKPYRTPLQATLQPGLGMGIRALYNKGMGKDLLLGV